MDPEDQQALALLEAPETEEERRALDALSADPRSVLAAARLRAGPGALRTRVRGGERSHRARRAGRPRRP